MLILFKRKGAFFLLFVLSLNSVLYCQTKGFCKKLEKLKDVVETYHFHPKPINDTLSVKVYELFIEAINIRKQFFTQKEIHLFGKDSLLFDDYISNTKCDFLSKYTNALTERIDASKLYLTSLKETTLDYSGSDTLYFDANRKFDHFETSSKAEKYWRKNIRYNILRRIIEDTTNLGFIKSNFKTLEEGVKEKVIDQELCRLDEILHKDGGISQFVEEAFFNAYLGYHDPHSVFFNTQERDLFNHQLANNQMSFGITTDKNNEGKIIISNVAPGSPAFKNSEIETNDVLKSITTSNGILEAYCISNEDILKLLNDDALKKATFKIQKRNGQIKTIKLKKGRVENEENSISGYILKSVESDALKVGYINISSFYTDLEKYNALGMANDVAKEIYKLKRDRIDGLVIDLRFDGGGSLKEAVDLSGLFIDRGPVTIMRYSNDETYTLKDTKRGAVFTAPLIVLVNQFSASASELFAGAMQDYNRAIVIGSKTHGKSSAQVVMPIGRSAEEGYVKLTTERFYRPTGKTHQSVGVIPDIQFPSLYDNFDTQEQYIPYALPNDTISVSMEPKVLASKDISTVIENSKRRISENLLFQNLTSLNKRLVKDYINKKLEYPLTLEDVYNDFDTMKGMWTATQDIMINTNSCITVSNTSSRKKVLKYNEAKRKENEIVLTELSQDIMLEEAFLIMKDYINAINTK